MNQDELNDTYLGKRVRVVKIDTPFDKNATMTGLCTFIGRNTLLNKMQVTIDRTPIFLDSYKQVSLALN